MTHIETALENLPLKPFVFQTPVFDRETCAAHLPFTCGDHEFMERVEFGQPSMPLSLAQVDAIHALLPILSYFCGVSYFKAFTAHPIQTCGMNVTAAHFFNQFYREGLGEFAYRNNITLPENLFNGTEQKINPVQLSLPSRPAVMIGGGKDSLVSIESLRAQYSDMLLLAVNPAPPILNCIERAGLPAIIIKRHIDRRLFDLNKNGALNGHVPITGILSMIAIIAGIIHGFNTLVLSNERSANEATVGDVNHQYSKSSAFERDFQNLLNVYAPNIFHYFSFLRPLSELHIAQLFARTDKYDDVFTSCNKAYSLTNPLTDGVRWCGTCPKCLFVFLALATATTPERSNNIFGQNILSQENLMNNFRELTGLSGHKPWECVGEILESAAALYHLSDDKNWTDMLVVKTLRSELLTQYGHDTLIHAYQESLTPSSHHDVPAQYLKVLHEQII